MIRLGLVVLMTLAFIACTHEKVTPAAEKTASPPASDAAAQAPSPSDKDDAKLRGVCCQQCAAAAKRDPAGMDIRAKDCRSYAGEFNGGPGLDERCVVYFAATRTTLGECWK